MIHHGSCDHRLAVRRQHRQVNHVAAGSAQVPVAVRGVHGQRRQPPAVHPAQRVAEEHAPARVGGAWHHLQDARVPRQRLVPNFGRQQVGSRGVERAVKRRLRARPAAVLELGLQGPTAPNGRNHRPRAGAEDSWVPKAVPRRDRDGDLIAGDSCQHVAVGGCQLCTVHRRHRGTRGGGGGVRDELEGTPWHWVLVVAAHAREKVAPGDGGRHHHVAPSLGAVNHVYRHRPRAVCRAPQRHLPLPGRRAVAVRVPALDGESARGANLQVQDGVAQKRAPRRHRLAGLAVPLHHQLLAAQGERHLVRAGDANHVRRLVRAVAVV
mmetsp:Transcript_3114/g.7658  ORF Transcript_3114/g.7658 Transcript_3114/m.7658 type:complete len:323 (+) Transcript_3114:2157-3125(+)